MSSSKKRRNDNLELLTKIIQAIHKSSNLEEIYKVALDSVIELENVDMAAIYLVDKEKQEAVLQSHRNLPEEYTTSAERIPHSKGITWKVINTGVMLNVEDAQKELDIGPAGRDLGHYSILGIPIRLEEMVIGVIWFFGYKKRKFKEKEISLLSTIGDQIAIAIAKAKLFEEMKKREEALKASEERYRQLFESNPHPMWAYDLETLAFLDVNNAAARHYGYSREEFLRMTIKDICSPEDIPALLSYLSKLNTGLDVAGVWKHRKKDGNIIHVEITSHTLNCLGRLAEVVLVNNITERKRAEEALWESVNQLSRKNRYETIINTVTQNVHQSLNLQDVLENAVEAMSNNIDGVDNIFISLVEGDEAVLKAHRGYPDWFIELVRKIAYPKGATWKTIIEGKPRYVADVDQDTVIGPAGRKVGTQSYLSMPIRYLDKTVGVININSLKKNAFDEEELKLLEAVAQQIEVAINNANQAEALRESEERYRVVAETASDAIITIDEESRILFANRTAQRIFGYATQEMLGQQITMLMPENLRNVHLSSIKRYVDTGKRNITWDRTELTGLHKSGKKVHLEISFGEFIKDDKHFFTGIIRDISERKRAEEKILEQAALLDKAQDAIVVRDLEQNIIFWNKGAERLYGWTAREAIGKNANEILYKEPPPQLIEAQKTVIEKGEWTGELHQLRKNGKEIIVESLWTLVYGDEGKPKSILIINTDITEKKKLEVQFLRAQRMESLGTLTGGIAHDLNNMLAPIMMALEMIRLRFKDEKSKSLIDTLETSTQRAADLVKQVLSFARGLEGEHTILQVKHLVSEIEKILKETFPKSIQIQTDIPKDLSNFYGDFTQLHQVLMNLCVNARDAMPNGGNLNISAENLFVDEHYAEMNIDAKVGPYIVITVSDTGIGIPAETIDRIFEPFFTTKEPGKGTGLGLSTTFRIVKDHRGFINVYSEVGKGTRFKVYLPAIETKETQKMGDKQIEEPTVGKGGLILVVDDEASIREITRVTLEKHGYMDIR